MSALANTSSTYQENQKLAASNAILSSANTDISVSARIDYNLRFAKQAVLVVGDNTEQYSSLASQYLVSLTNNQHEDDSSHINVAFLPASSKLNDIQVRCRLVEQLFVNTLFDPEQSLAVSVLRFANQHSEAISIVIDHAHALSLQVKYELSQLVNLAKKSKLTINVVLFGVSDTLQELSENKSLFKNKLVVIDASSGQVLGLETKNFSTNKRPESLALWKKLSLIGALLLVTGALLWVYLLIIDDVNQQALKNKSSLVQLNPLDKNPSSSNFVDVSANNELTQANKKKTKNNEDSLLNSNVVPEYSQATSEDINLALLTEFTVKKTQPLAAEAGDVLQALSATNNPIKSLSATPKVKEEISAEQAAVLINAPEQISGVHRQYYQNKALEYSEGYVVQIAGFSESVLSERFLKQYPTETLYSYDRLLTGKNFTVVTSRVFSNKEEAKAAIALLPTQLIERKPWLKSISSVIAEINTFTR